MGAPVAFEAAEMGRLMPMFLQLDDDGAIADVGPTLAKVLPEESILGRNIFDVFTIKHQKKDCANKGLAPLTRGLLRIALIEPPGTVFKAMLVPLAGGGFLMNISFGIGVVQAVGDHGLSASDFPATDLTIEMLYLNEAKSAVLQESHNLIKRLQGAKIAAEEKAFTDTLTGLKNRRAMDFVLNRLVLTDDDFGLINIDLDFFKQVNDTMGHAAGDYVLQYVARIMVAETRGEDTVARVGGDEFVLILKGLTDVDLMRAISERIIATLEKPIKFNGEELRISASIGATVTTNYTKLDAQEMLHHADLALYTSKKAGRAVFSAFSWEMSDRRTA